MGYSGLPVAGCAARTAYSDPDIKVPSYVNVAFAQWLAMFIAEGWALEKDAATVEGGAKGVGFSNTDKKLINRFADLTQKLFGIKPIIRVRDKDTQFGQFTCNKTVYNAVVHSRQLADWLINIGCCLDTTSMLGDSPAKFKVIPDCILQSSAQVWRAFLAMYAECDGTYSKNYTISWLSASPTIIQQIHCMLSALGYQALKRETYVSISHEDSLDFAKRVTFIGGKQFNCKANKSKYSKLFGLPINHWIAVLNNAKVKFDRHGSYYLTEDRHIICHSRHSNSFGFGRETIRLNYDRYKDGKYKEFLTLLKQINRKEYEKLVFALKQRYFITPVTSISDNGKQKVYDLSMENDPSFVANGIIVHNSYAASESAYSTFVETVNSYRNHLTAKIFYNKLFPLIAVVNDLYVDGAERPQTMNIGQFLFNANNRQALKMPKLHWHKQLEVRDEQSQFDMLEKLTEHGIPVPISTWVAAAGVDIEALLKDLKESDELKKRLEPFMDGAVNESDDSLYASAKPDLLPHDPDDPDAWDTTRMKQVFKALRPYNKPSILSRKFSEEDNAEWSVSPDGKRHLKANQQAAKKDRLWKIAKIAAKYNRDRNYRQSIIDKNKERGVQYLKGF